MAAKFGKALRPHAGSVGLCEYSIHLGVSVTLKKVTGGGGLNKM